MVRLLAAMSVLVLLVGGCKTVETAAAPAQMPPFERYFTPEAVQAPLLSPDGKYVSYIGRHQDAFNIFVAPVDDVSKARPVTHERGRGIQWYTVSGAVTYSWTPDGRRILYLKDNDGDEHNRLYVVDVETGESRNLTPGENVSASIIAVSPSRPGHILAAVKESISEGSLSYIFGSDVVEIDLATGAQTVVMKAVPFAGVFADNDLKIRFAWLPTAELGVDIFKLDDKGEPSPFYQIAYEDLAGLEATGQTNALRFSQDNRTLYFLDAVGRDTVALAAFDIETGAKTIIAADGRVDIRDVLFHPTTKAPQAYGVNWTKLDWKALDPAIADDLALLQKPGGGVVLIPSRSADGRYWLVKRTIASKPDAYELYDSQTGGLKTLFVTTPELVGLPLVEMFPYVIKARDGLEMVGYYTVPFAADPQQTGKPSKPSPTLVYVHGGPSDERPMYAYAPMVQWLASRGYSFLYVNFRGGAGFGKSFLRAADMEWGGKMHDDVVDQVRWAIDQGISDPERIGILGGSYGGYETLIAMTKSPDVFACGADIVGPSDLTEPMPHWNADWMARVMGDPRTPEGQAMLKTRSPAYLVSPDANRPILIGQGDKDSRVPTRQSDRMVKAMQAAGAPVVYLRFPDEGHGFLRPENTSAFMTVMEAFFAKCLKGETQPLPPARFEGSSVILGAGEDYMPGLAAAIEASRAP